MNDTYEHYRNILNSMNSFNLLEKLKHNAPRNNKQITNLNPSNYHLNKLNIEFKNRQLALMISQFTVKIPNNLLILNRDEYFN